MKIKYLSVLLLGTLLASCGGGSGTSSSTSPSTTPSSGQIISSETSSSEKVIDISTLKILSPTQAPAFAFYKEFDNENFVTNGIADNVISQINSSSEYDVVVAPTSDGLQALNKFEVGQAPFKIASTITFGNLYIVATGLDKDATLNAGDCIVSPFQNKLPDQLFHYIYGDTLNDSITYVAKPPLAIKALKDGKVGNKQVDYVILPQPAVNACLSDAKATTHGTMKLYKSMQELYKEKSGGKQITQASVFVKSSLDREVVDLFLTNLETNVKALLTNPMVLKTELENKPTEEVEAKYGLPYAPA